ncbi:MAG: alpha/beta fold hydrolase [Flavobacteriales bacterium]|nr:alpha/beta fold hydrolase [Flavobacteriales bacterium]
MQLNYKEYGSGYPFVIIHGLFGSSDNWTSIAKILGEQFHVITIDVRNHGRSPYSDELNYDLMATDLIELLDNLGLEKVNLLGHSMGGKMAMQFANDFPDRLNKMIVVDIGPEKYPPHHGEKIEGLLSIDLSSLNSRVDADEQLSQSIPGEMVRQFLLKNLYRDENRMFAWRFNLHSLANNLEEIFSEISFNQQVIIPSLFVKGGQSEFVGEKSIKLIEANFANFELETFENSGHWLHAQEPKRLIESIIQFIKKD